MISIPAERRARRPPGATERRNARAVRHHAAVGATQSSRNLVAMSPQIFRRVVLLLALSACQLPDEEPLEETVELRFEARVADQPFACGATFSGLGADGVSGTPQDLRLYVHDVRLVDGDGVEYPVTLDDDGQHQGGGVALLDFEDGRGVCTGGTPALHTTLRGTVGARPRHSAHGPPGLRFRIGVPGEYNHVSRDALPAPLTEPTMSWSIDDGHVFFVARGRFGADAGFVQGVHVGSTGCIGEESDVVCTQSNRPEITLAAFDPADDVVVVDWAAVFAGIPLAGPPADCDTSVEPAVCGCDSVGPEALCRPMFAALGLEWTSGASTGEQTIFRVE